MIQVANLTKSYGPDKGNHDISFQITKGQIYAILGPNGSGKTTLIRQMIGLIKSDAGSITVDEYNAWTKHANIMAFTGYVPGEIIGAKNLKGVKFLRRNAQFRQNVEWAYVETLIKYFELDANVKIKKMSKGMKQKIAIINALMHKPSLLVLDEPSSGLDLIMQKKFQDLILKLNQEQATTVIICSHIFEEVAFLAHQVLVLKNGSVIEEFSVKKQNIKQLQKRFLSHFNEGELL